MRKASLVDPKLPGPIVLTLGMLLVAGVASVRSRYRKSGARRARVTSSAT